jgi:hypothetical protein
LASSMLASGVAQLQSTPDFCARVS